MSRLVTIFYKVALRLTHRRENWHVKQLALSPFLPLVGTRAVREMLSIVLDAPLPRTVGHVGSLAWSSERQAKFVRCVALALSSRLLPSLGNQTKLACELALSRFLSPSADVSLLFPIFGRVGAGAWGLASVGPDCCQQSPPPPVGSELR